MTDNTLPVAKIQSQILSELPIGTGTVLVDDPIALVDDPHVLVGSQTTQVKELKASTNTNAPKGSIKQRR